MLNVFVARPQGLTRVELAGRLEIPQDALWIDLFEPTIAEERAVESALGIEVPTREEMKEIETSNRLYEEDGALYMTATVGAKLDTERPESAAVTFILSNGRLVTNRYVDPKPFQRFVAYAQRHPTVFQTSAALLSGLIEAFTERIADVLERVGGDLDQVSGGIFARHNGGTDPSSRDLRAMIERIGFNGELNSKARESLVSFGRLLMFVQQSTVVVLPQDQRSRIKSISRDVTALSDHSSFLGSKVSFLLEATLGLINIEQNNIIKIFSVAAVMFMPPTLIASIYGMNFHFMPELSWWVGYPFALGIMVASMAVTYILFKRKGWL
jgi:magnesium transporter